MAALTLELELPEAVDDAAVARLLGDRLRVEIGRGLTADRVLLDTFDAGCTRAACALSGPGAAPRSGN